jgi:NAD(P)H-dependent FMN reductase
VKYTLIIGSLRKESLNRKLLSIIEQIINQDSLGEVSMIDREDIDLPLYNQDIEDKAMPEKVKEIAGKVKASDALIICSPEYNGSISSPLKNTIDWISRIRPIPFKGLPILLTGASPSGLGARRAMSHAKVPFDAIGAFVYPENFGLSKAHEAFSEKGELMDSSQQERLSALISDFDKFSKKLKAE